MRLINTANLRLEEFFNRTIPEYVILSHSWGENQVSFLQFKNGVLNRKIENFCKQAQEDRFQYTWIDTCCTI